MSGFIRQNDPLKTHTPQIWGVEIHPPNSGGESSKNPCFTVFSGEHSLNLGGEIFTPQIWGVWVLRVLVFESSIISLDGFSLTTAVSSH